MNWVLNPPTPCRFGKHPPEPIARYAREPARPIENEEERDTTSEARLDEGAVPTGTHKQRSRRPTTRRKLLAPRRKFALIGEQPGTRANQTQQEGSRLRPKQDAKSKTGRESNTSEASLQWHSERIMTDAAHLISESNFPGTTTKVMLIVQADLPSTNTAGGRVGHDSRNMRTVVSHHKEQHQS